MQDSFLEREFAILMNKRRSRKKRILLAGLAIALCWFLFQLFGPSPSIVVSPQTTYITEPLSEDGLPNYLAYVCERSSKGVTPENNAAVLIWQALGPAPIPADRREVFFSELGIEPLLEQGNYFVGTKDEVLVDSIADKLEQAEWQPGDYSGEATEEAEEWMLRQLRVARAEELPLELITRPWRSEELPPLADWLEANRQALDLAVEASQRPEFYGPAISSNEFGPPLITEDFPTEREYHELTRGLAIRAMRHLGEDRPLQAHRDLLAAMRLAEHVSDSQFSFSMLSGTAGQEMCVASYVVLAENTTATADQLREILRELQPITACADARLVMTHAERMLATDAVVYFIRILHSSNLEGEVIAKPNWARYVRMDWNHTLVHINKMFDKIDQALLCEDDTVREKQLTAAFDEMHQNPTPWELVQCLFSMRERSHMAYRYFGSLLSPNPALYERLSSSRAKLEIMKLAVALAVYRAEHGEYPESLEALLPEILPKLPVDHYHELPYSYSRTEDGYLLYSFGPNGVDDSGSNSLQQLLEGREMDDSNLLREIPFGADDIAIRLPRPRFQLPAMMAE